MNIEQERQRIMELWEAIEEETSPFLGYLWEHRRELGELEARVERLEPKVIKLLEVIPTLRKDSPEYEAHCKHFVRLIHHIEPTEEWMRKIRDDLEFMSGEIKKMREAYKQYRLSRSNITTSQSDVAKLIVPKDFIDKVQRIYLDLVQRNLDYDKLTIKPYFFELNDQKTFQGSELEKKIYFVNESQNTWASFVGFIQQGHPIGLLYPNPRLTYNESMSFIFQNLNRNNFEFGKMTIKPVQIIRREQGLWEALVD